MPLTLQSLKQNLSDNQIAPAYFIAGPELFLVQQGLKLIRSRILSPASLDFNPLDFNYEVFCCGKVDPKLIGQAIQTLPVLSDKRIVVCESAHSLSPSDWKVLKPFLQKPVESAVLVFVSLAPDKRKKIIKDLQKLCVEISARTPTDRDWPQWITWMGAQENLSFSPSATGLIKEYAGSSLLNMQTEIKKLRAFLEGANPTTPSTKTTQVSEEHILSIVARVQPENIFALSKAISQKDIPLALITLNRLIEDKQSEFGTLNLIARHFRVLVRIKEGLKKGLSRAELSRQSATPQFFLESHIQAAKGWKDSHLISTLNLLKETDKALKSSPLPARLWLERLITKACHQF